MHCKKQTRGRILVFVSTVLLKVVKFSNSLWLHFAKSKGSEEALVAETMVWPTPFLINMLTALKGSLFYFYLLLLQLVLCRVAALKSLPVHHP